MKKRALLIIFLTVFIDLVGFGIIIPLSPFLARDFGADALDVGLLMAIYSGMQFLFSPFWGKLSDRVGRRPIILLSLLGASLSHLMFAWSHTLVLLFVARALAGLFGANISTAMAYIADVTDEKNRSKGMGMIGAAFGLGFVLGPALGAYFGKVGMDLGSVPPLGQSFAAVAASVICFVNFVMALKFLPESLPVENRARLEKRKDRFKMLAQYIKRPVMGHLMVMFLFSTLAMANMEASLFLLVQDDFNWTVVDAGLGFAYVGLIMVFTQGYLVRKFMANIGERKMIFLGLGFSVLGFLGIAFAPTVFWLGVAVTLLGLGNGFTHPAINGSVSLLSGASEQGAVMGVNHSLSAMARVFGPAIGGFLYRDLGHEYPFVAAGGFGAIAVVLGLTVFKKLPNSGKDKKDSCGAETKDISRIGGFQLFNILNSDAPYMFISLLDIEGIETPHQNIMSKAQFVDKSKVSEFVSENAQDPSYPILVVCRDGSDSQMVVSGLVSSGYVNVYMVEGGLNALNRFDPNS